MTKNLTKITAGKNLGYFFDRKLHLLIPRPPRKTSKLKEKLSALKRENPALQNMKFINFFIIFVGHFLPIWIRFWIPNLDSASGSTDPIESGSDPDPDPKHCLQQKKYLQFF
jgi:hypothetical protein